jgi:hypothetical protein
MKTRHVLFSGIFFLLGNVYQILLNNFFPQGSILKYTILIIGGFILFYTLASIWKSSILNSKPSAFVWIISVAIATSGFFIAIHYSIN